MGARNICPTCPRLFLVDGDDGWRRGSAASPEGVPYGIVAGADHPQPYDGASSTSFEQTSAPEAPKWLALVTKSRPRSAEQVPDIPGWDSGIHSAIRDVIEFIGRRLDLLTTSKDYPQSRQIAAAYLARTRRVVIAMDLLYEAGTPDLIGGSMRVCLEAWITGMWVLAVGQPGLDILLANYQATTNKLVKNAGLGLELFEPIEWILRSLGAVVP